MSKTLEIEFKTLLSASEFSQTCQYFQIQETNFNTQTNYYFDTPDFKLKQKGMGLRIRLFDNTAECTLKIPQKVGLLEVTDMLSNTQALAFIQQETIPTKGNVASELIKLGLKFSELKLIGYLTTKRAEIKIPQGLLVLDESWYNKKYDFELELEVTNFEKGEQDFQHLLDSLHVTLVCAPNKIQRMMNTLNTKN